MLLWFSVSNYRSLRTLQTLSLHVSNRDKTLPENCIEPQLPGLTGKLLKWSKGAAIYGANASGKTTVLEALKVLSRLVIESAKTTDPKAPIEPIEPFALDPVAAKEATAFAIMFIQGGTRYDYRVAATRERILHESLRTYPTASGQIWFARDWDAKTQSYVYSFDAPDAFTRDEAVETVEKRTLPNMLYLSKLVAENNTQVEPVFRWFKEELVIFRLGANRLFDESFTSEQIAGKTSYMEQILKLLRCADIGVTGASVREESAPDKIQPGMFSVNLLHKGAGGRQIPLNLDVQSSGTQRLYALAGPWLDILQKGRVVCIDELDTSMHPLMVRELLRLFFSAETNRHRAQIIFTTHNPLLLDPTLMRRDQVWFTEKDKEGATELYSLTDYEPRKGESLVRGYMGGRYGGVPYVPTGLLDNFQPSVPAPMESDASNE